MPRQIDQGHPGGGCCLCWEGDAGDGKTVLVFLASWWPPPGNLAAEAALECLPAALLMLAESTVGTGLEAHSPCLPTGG